MKANIEEIRNNAKKVFGIYLKKEDNIVKLEKMVFKYSNQNKGFTSFVEFYKTYVYETALLLKKKVKFSTITVLIKNNKFGWGHEQFNYVSNLINEQNDFIKNPFEVEEGIFQCKAFIKETGKICGSRRVYSYAKQDRSSDEGTSVYAQCMNCGCKWRERG